MSPTDRELLDVIREFRAADWNTLTFAYDDLEVSLAKRRPGDPIRGFAAAAPRSTAGPAVIVPDASTASAIGDDVPPGEAAGPSAQEVTASGGSGLVGSEDGSTEVIEAVTVGIFWVAPSPGADPFVSPGDTVVAGQELAIIEVMKLMTSVVSERGGTIEAVLVGNGEMVESGQPLFRVRVDEAAGSGT